jgi:hypothetical protein
MKAGFRRDITIMIGGMALGVLIAACSPKAPSAPSHAGGPAKDQPPHTQPK